MIDDCEDPIHDLKAAKRDRPVELASRAARVLEWIGDRGFVEERGSSAFDFCDAWQAGGIDAALAVVRFAVECRRIQQAGGFQRVEAVDAAAVGAFRDAFIGGATSLTAATSGLLERVAKDAGLATGMEVPKDGVQGWTRADEWIHYAYHLNWLLAGSLAGQGRFPGAASHGGGPRSVEVVAVGTSGLTGLGACVVFRLEPWGWHEFMPGVGSGSRAGFRDLMLAPAPLLPVLTSWDDEFAAAMRQAMEAAAARVLAQIDGVLAAAGEEDAGPVLVPGFEPRARCLPHLAWTIARILLVKCDGSRIERLTREIDPQSAAIQEQLLECRGGGLGLLSGRSASASLYWGFYDSLRGAAPDPGAVVVIGQIRSQLSVDACLGRHGHCFARVDGVGHKIRILTYAKQQGFLPGLDRILVVEPTNDDWGQIDHAACCGAGIEVGALDRTQ